MLQIPMKSLAEEKMLTSLNHDQKKSLIKDAKRRIYENPIG